MHTHAPPPLSSCSPFTPFSSFAVVLLTLVVLCSVHPPTSPSFLLFSFCLLLLLLVLLLVAVFFVFLLLSFLCGCGWLSSHLCPRSSLHSPSFSLVGVVHPDRGAHEAPDPIQHSQTMCRTEGQHSHCTTHYTHSTHPLHPFADDCDSMLIPH
jgi:hypothetical protein